MNSHQTTKAIEELSDLTKIDPAYSCVMTPAAKINLKSEKRTMYGQLMWAYVPQSDDSLKRMIVFVADGEPPVENLIIEGFSTLPIK